MTKRGRPVSQTPASAYEYRRVIYLVQMLSRFEVGRWHDILRDLAEDWNITHDGTFEDCLKQLAQATLKHAKQD